MNAKSLRSLAIAAASRAYSPYSKAHVGCAVVCENGEIFTGCNIENSSYGATVCAERVAIFKAIEKGNKKIEQLYLYTKAGWSPCGMCRQVISEFAVPNLKITIGKESEPTETTISFRELFPLGFTPKDMGINE